MAMAEEFFGPCQRGDLEAVQAALESGVDVNIQDRTRDRRTGLMWALLANKPEVAIFLLEQPGININHTTDSGTTALHKSARSEENIEVLALLLKSKLELLELLELLEYSKKILQNLNLSLSFFTQDESSQSKDNHLIPFKTIQYHLKALKKQTIPLSPGLY